MSRPQALKMRIVGVLQAGASSIGPRLDATYQRVSLCLFHVPAS